jgi:hypothetical protein
MGIASMSPTVSLRQKSGALAAARDTGAFSSDEDVQR